MEAEGERDARRAEGAGEDAQRIDREATPKSGARPWKCRGVIVAHLAICSSFRRSEKRRDHRRDALRRDRADGELHVRLPPVHVGREPLERDGMPRVTETGCRGKGSLALDVVSSRGCFATDNEPVSYTHLTLPTSDLV